MGWLGGGCSAGVPGGHFWRQAKEVQLTLAHERRLWSERISGVAVGSWLQAELGPGLRLHAQTRGFCVPLRSQPPWPGQDGSVCSAAGLQGRRPTAGTGGMCGALGVPAAGRVAKGRRHVEGCTGLRKCGPWGHQLLDTQFSQNSDGCHIRPAGPFCQGRGPWVIHGRVSRDTASSLGE